MSDQTKSTTEPMTLSSFIPSLAAARGHFDFPMSNDYMFRATFQTDELALKGLISSLLRIPPENIRSVVITNPVALGECLTDKEYRLDVNVLLNDSALINLEMQMEWQSGWHDRSLVYLCRNFDSLSKGQQYSEARPALHIGILREAPILEGREFYSENMLMNVKSHKIYSDKFALRVLRLDCIDNATAEDKAWKTDRWAGLLKAATWEDIMTIAEHDQYLMSASNSLYLLNADEMARKRARDREDYYRDIRTYEKRLAEKDAIIAELQARLAAGN